MKLTFKRPFLSISEFPPVDLPSFTVVTGLNGAGKTHFLKAILGWSIDAGITPADRRHRPSNAIGLSDQQPIRMFNWQDLVPSSQATLDPEAIKKEKERLATRYRSAFQNKNVSKLIEEYNYCFLPGGENPTFSIKFPIPKQEARNLPEERLNILRYGKEGAPGFIEENIKVNLTAYEIRYFRELARIRGKRLMDLSEDDIDSPSAPFPFIVDLFANDFSHLFVTYRNLKLGNEFAEFQAKKGKTIKFANEEDFISAYGDPPWETINRILTEAELDFRLTRPELDAYDEFHASLIKKSTNSRVEFAELSSGEKILISLALISYYNEKKWQQSDPPSLLLLDEIDAPLHPSMIKKMLKILDDILCRSLRINVILTTHSATTVALAPDESTYVMEVGRPGLHKVSKAKALNVLTDGVPTISLSFDGRRQVFVESPSDVQVYGLLYEILKSDLDSDRSLQFISTGKREKGVGDTNTGCALVKQLVEKLSVAGNESVFGLIDWDGVASKNVPFGRIFVLAHERKDGLENVLLDPLLIGLAIFHRFRDELPKLFDGERLSYVQATRADSPKLQQIVTAVVKRVINNPSGQLVKTTYRNGLQLDVDQDYFLTDDHKLEDLILAAFPSFKSETKGDREKDKLKILIANTVVRDNPSFLPKDLWDIYRALLDADAHMERP